MSLGYKEGKLFLGEKGDLSKIISENQGHACYVYDLANVTTRYEKLKSSLSEVKNLGIHYALKANAHPELLKHMKSLGAKVDTVSAGEIKQAIENGFEAQDVIFSGVAKSVEEIKTALELDIKQINVESPQELRRIGEIAKSYNKKMAVAFRMNPEVNPVTHPYITTGMTENKFGMDRSFIPELTRILKEFPENLYLRGLTMHIGSQLVDLSAMREALQKLLSIYREFEVLGFKMESLDIGGGVGIHYDQMDEAPDFELMNEYGAMVSKELQSFDGEVLIEPGRVLVGRCGVLLCQVEYIKPTSFKTFVILNTGMHHLMRPALYQATHRIVPLKLEKSREKKVYDLVGPICESTDFLGKNRNMQELNQGDYLAICDTGAYGFCMSNNYNFHEKPKEIILS